VLAYAVSMKETSRITGFLPRDLWDCMSSVRPWR